MFRHLFVFLRYKTYIMLDDGNFSTSSIKNVTEFYTDRASTEYCKGFIRLFREFIAKEAFTRKVARLLKTWYIRNIAITASAKNDSRGRNFYSTRTIVKVNIHNLIGYKASCATIYVYIIESVVIIVDTSRFVNFIPCTFRNSVPVHSSIANINTDFFEFFYLLDRISCCNHNLCRNTTAS